MTIERIKFTVSMELTKPQAMAMQAFFEKWNHCAIMGQSRHIAFYVDGDGDFKPNCRIQCNKIQGEISEKIRQLACYGVNNEPTIHFDYDAIAGYLDFKKTFGF